MKKQLFRIHSFCGIVSGQILFLIVWSGTFAVISYEMDWLITPDARVDALGTPVSWGALEETFQASFPDARIMSIEAPQYQYSAAEVVARSQDTGVFRVYVHPYSGDLQGAQSVFNLHRFFVEYHYSLFMDKPGAYVVTTCSLFLLSSLLSSLLFYKRWWKEFFRWPRGRASLLRNLHVFGGLWSIGFLLIIGITGFWYLYEKVYHDLGGPVDYVGVEPYGLNQVAESDGAILESTLLLDEAVKRGLSSFPDLNVSLVAYGWYSGDKDVVYMEGKVRNPFLRARANQVHVSQKTGEVLWKNTADDLSPYWLWSNMADPIHFGSFAGLWSKVFYFAFGMVVSFLALSGTVIHIRRLRRSEQSWVRHRWRFASIIGAATAAMFLTSMWNGYQQALRLGPSVSEARTVPGLSFAVVAVILVWVAITLAILLASVTALHRAKPVQLGAVTRAGREAAIDKGLAG